MRTNKTAKAIHKTPQVAKAPKAKMSNDTKEKIDLYKQVATSLVMEDKFYESGKNAHGNIIRSIMKVEDTQWVLKLAAYARNEMHLRTVPLVLATEVALDTNRDKTDTRKYLNSIIQRPDEIAELLAYTKQRCIELKRDQLPQMILKGITPVWNKFGRYHISKYRCEDRKLTLRDAVFLTHPRYNSEEQEELFNELVEGTLKIDEDTETWEHYISTHGSSRESWQHVIPNMGYMALLRNINNFLRVGIDRASTNHVCSYLSDPNMVHKSKQLPFRFYTAYKTVGGDGDVTQYRKALELALNHSCANIPVLDGRSAILIDISGSMRGGTISERSTISPIEIAALMGCMMKYVNSDDVVMTFDTDAKIVNPNDESVLKNTMNIINNARGGATYLYKAINTLESHKLDVNRIIVLSDMNTYGKSEVDALRNYRHNINPNVKVFTIDLAGYRHGRGELDSSDGVYQLAGYSDRVFTLIEALCKDPEAVVKHIDEISV